MGLRQWDGCTLVVLHVLGWISLALSLALSYPYLYPNLNLNLNLNLNCVCVLSGKKCVEGGGHAQMCDYFPLHACGHCHEVANYGLMFFLGGDG